MHDLHNIPIETIEGIGPATAGLFQSKQILYAGDLIRFPLEELYEIVSTVASKDEVWAWQGMALLMQVTGVNHQLAEALYHEGVETVSELSQQTLGKLQELFERALDRKLISQKPSEDDSVTMISEAMRLEHTGSFDGRVLDRDGQPVADATVIMAGISVKSNSNGHFRLYGIPLSGDYGLVAMHEDHGLMMTEVGELSYVHDMMFDHQLQFTEADQRRSTIELSEQFGDVLPAIGAFPMVSQTRPESELEDDDLLQVYDFYKSSKHAKLLSRFKRFKEGEFIAASYKVSLSLLPKGIKKGEHYRFCNGTFEKLSLDSRGLYDEIISRQAYREIVGEAGFSSQQKFKAYFSRKEALLNS